MKLAHFNAFKPLCPLCRMANRGDFILNLGFILQQSATEILQGALVCSNCSCQCEYPIIDGIPYIFPDIRKTLSEHHLEILLREDLPLETLNILHEAAGANSWLAIHRQHLSSYMWNHYESTCGNVANLIGKAHQLSQLGKVDKTLEVGCSVGRGTFELAQLTGGLALGIDVNPLMLRKAAHLMRHGHGVYDLRHSGMLFERREIAFDSPARERVDFWAADALALPFSDQSVGGGFSMNVLDCVASPVGMLNEILRVMGQSAAICTPWDWTSAATPEENWIGGHSPRANCAGDSFAMLKSLLPAHLKILGEAKDLAWEVRMHDKHTAHYQTDLIAIGH